MNNELIKSIASLAYSTRETIDNTLNLSIEMITKDIDGDFVECGVGAGSQIGIMGYVLDLYKDNGKIWAYDSYEGIPLAGPNDADQPGIGKITHDVNVSKEELLRTSGITAHSLENVKTNIKNWGLSEDRFIYIKGWFQHTLPNNTINKISLLRLDGDLYESTKICLETLFDKVVSGGVIIIDDWALPGCRKACDEFFKDYSSVTNINIIQNSTPVYFYKK